MNPGRLRHLIEIEQVAQEKNEFGENEPAWHPFARAWAEIKPIKAGEFFSAKGLEHEVTHRLIIRYISGFKPDMRIKHKGRIFGIDAVRNFFERDEYLEILAREECDG